MVEILAGPMMAVVAMANVVSMESEIVVDVVVVVVVEVVEVELWLQAKVTTQWNRSYPFLLLATYERVVRNCLLLVSKHPGVKCTYQY